MSHNRSYIHYRQNYYMTFGKRSQASYSMWPSWKLIKTVFLPSKSTSLGVRKVQKTLRITWQEADFQAPISIQLPPLTGKVQTATDISSQPSLRCRFQCYLHYNEHYFVWHARTLYFNKKKKKSFWTQVHTQLQVHSIFTKGSEENTTAWHFCPIYLHSHWFNF